MADADQYPGTAHGKTTPLRWDTTTAAGAIVIGALVFLVWANFTFSASASVGTRR